MSTSGTTSTIDHNAFFIDGSWRPADGTDHFDVISPRSERRVGRVPAASKADIDAAVAAARRAFDEGEWPRLTPAQRADHLTRLADGIERRRAELAELITEELGCTLVLSQVYQTVSPVMSLNYSAEIGRGLRTAEVRVSDLSSLAGRSAGGGIIPMAGASLVVKEPVGVVASFPAYNFALPAIGQKAGPALVAGCTVVVKVTEPNPLAIFVIGEICEEIGLPPGVLNIVAARAPESEYLVRHPGVDMVSFTGSVAVGARIGAACGELIRPCVLELGGKSAAIVLEDARMEDVLPVLIGASVGTNAGQSCVAQTRLLVPESQYRAYAEALADGFASLKVGDPMEADTVVGPLITSRHRDRVDHYVETARKEGATIAYGGRRPPGLTRGWYYEPTLVTDAHNGMTVAREEIFGPVAALIPHRGEDDAVRIANDSELGLAGSVFTADAAHGFEVARRVRTGTFSVNTFAADLGSPFGGFKQSGLGREHGPGAVEEFLLTKTISTDPGAGLPVEVTQGIPLGTGPGTHGPVK
ncbi:aldehyde dehydrogenase [Streptomyces sp. NPDC055059]|uniref:aldehyde dehydrogenase n=1 Tax=unclassified Streptomyces TaxID=2593676 RepID=UPI0032461CBF